MDRVLGPEAAQNYRRRLAEGFFVKYLSGDAVLDIGYRGGNPKSVPITDKAIGIELDYPGYDGKHLPFPDESQDAVFVSHCLEHIEDYQSVLADWYRVLKVSGFLIIAVPHRELYERKSMPPSRFNSDHKRFYTPRSLLAEIEEALPLGGYRVRSLRDIDDGFDYSVPPEDHARGSYEIELVLQKIVVPGYIDRFRTSEVAKQVLLFFAGMITQAVLAERCGHQRLLAEIQAILKQVTLPPFGLLTRALRESTSHEARTVTRDELIKVLRPLIEATAFDETWYLDRHEGVRVAVAAGQITSGREHYVKYGYFEGRAPLPTEPLFG